MIYVCYFNVRIGLRTPQAHNHSFESACIMNGMKTASIDVTHIRVNDVEWVVFKSYNL